MFFCTPVILAQCGYFLAVSFFAVSIAALFEVSAPCLGVSIVVWFDFPFEGSPQAEIETAITEASSPIFSEFLMVLFLKFCIDTANFKKVTYRKNIKKATQKWVTLCHFRELILRFFSGVFLGSIGRHLHFAGVFFGSINHGCFCCIRYLGGIGSAG
jgi:hypothetical protein